MSRTIPSALTTHLAGEVISLAKCLKITRSDNVVFRFTTHDVDIVIGSETYLSNVGLNISALQSSDDLSVDNAEMSIGVDGVLVIADDFRFGLYDRAQFEYFLVNWETPADGVVYMKRGEFGDITLQDETVVQVQLRGLTHALQRAVTEKYSATCRVNLGGLKCGVVNVPTRIRRHRQRVKTWDWYLVPTANVTGYSGTNLGFEADGDVANGTSGISTWVYGVGSYWQAQSAFTAGEGSNYLEGGDDGAGAGTGTEFSMTQTIATSALGMGNTDIDNGFLTVDMAGLIAATSDSLENPGRFSIEQFDTSGNTLKFEYSEYITPVYQEWEGIGLSVFVLPTARSIKFGVHTRKNEGTAATVAFDDIVIRFWENQDSTWGGAVFRTTRLPGFAASEQFQITNPSFESDGAVANSETGITGWLYGTDSWWQVVASVGAFSPQTGGFLLEGGDNSSGSPDQIYELYQIHNIQRAPDETDLANGWYYLTASVDYGKIDAASDPRFVVEFLEADDTPISSLDSGYDTASALDTWHTFTLSGRVPALTAKMRFSLFARSGASGAANVVFEDIISYQLTTAFEDSNEEEYALLDTTEPTYDYTLPEYTTDGAALAQAQNIRFAYGEVTDITDTRTFEDTAINQTAALMYSGKIVWLSGDNAGTTSFIRVWDNSGKIARLYDGLRNAIQVGDTYVYALGCDKTITRCAVTFGNAHNFRGEPYLPGPARVIEFLTTTT